ncbi:MAG: hypothetical protein M1832_000809 [Thelocarpon impressellum]|nr:MAG: hypothetical protein M1832_000809 [Thelocarpon impressellum]
MGIIETTNALPLPTFVTQHTPLLSPFTHPITNTTYALTLETASSITPAALDACFTLLSATSKADYEASSVGWRPGEKRREMRLPDLKYLLVADRQGRVMAFTSFMLTYEDGHEVVYVYEIHLLPELRGCGLGSVMMDVVERLGRSVGVSKAMLTVFLANEAGVRFYERMGYIEDDYSPGPKVLRGGKVKMPSYIILSKGLT